MTFGEAAMQALALLCVVVIVVLGFIGLVTEFGFVVVGVITAIGIVWLGLALLIWFTDENPL